MNTPNNPPQLDSPDVSLDQDRYITLEERCARFPMIKASLLKADAAKAEVLAVPNCADIEWHAVEEEEESTTSFSRSPHVQSGWKPCKPWRSGRCYP